MSSELIFGLFCLVFVVGTFWLSAVFEGRRRDREQKTQQVVEETSDPRAVIRVLASVRLQASWVIKMLFWLQSCGNTSAVSVLAACSVPVPR
ncbi:MAG: hypothetical protein ACFNKE_04010, partial [Neisseria elongata]